MNIALVGFGKMGKMIYSLVEENDNVVAIIDPFSKDTLVSAKSLTKDNLNKADVVIDFSHPSTILENIKFYIKNSIPCVIGTTGWYDDIDELKQLTKEYSGSSLIYSGNFSLGVAVFREIVKFASSILSKTSIYDVFLNEIHHKDKADSPSGTSLLLAEAVRDNFDGKDTIVSEELKRKIEKNEIHCSSTRGGYITGTHSVVYDSQVDSIELVHRAKSREGFAKGALIAASWVKDRTGFYNLDDLVSALIN
ncbi:MAG: 4-hydroxy-tetrahydrodipicolinate reductase [Pleomorphochaeta sp.]